MCLHTSVSELQSSAHRSCMELSFQYIQCLSILHLLRSHSQQQASSQQTCAPLGLINHSSLAPYEINAFFDNLLWIASVVTFFDMKDVSETKLLQLFFALSIALLVSSFLAVPIISIKFNDFVDVLDIEVKKESMYFIF